MLLDLEFLQTCMSRDLIPKFLRFKLAVKNSKSVDYHKYQKTMLADVIKDKELSIRSMSNRFINLRDKLRTEISFIDFTHICTVYLCSNDNRLNDIQNVHDKKLYNLNIDSHIHHHDIDKILHNLSSHSLSSHENRLLSKGLNFSILPNKLHYTDYFLNLNYYIVTSVIWISMIKISKTL